MNERIKAGASGFKSYANTKVRLPNREALRIDINLEFARRMSF
jgi:hypothetical protein